MNEENIPEKKLNTTEEGSSSSKLRSVPIPQPLILKRRTSKSSFSSSVDEQQQQGQHHQHGEENYPTSPSGSVSAGNSTGGEFSSNRRSFLFDMDYSSSPGSDNDYMYHRSPPPPPLRYSSPPAGSGGKYMVRSKRASWIDGSTYDSTPSTPTAQPQLKIPPLCLPKSIEDHHHHHSLKSGSLSKLREDRQLQPRRESSLDSSTASSSLIEVVSDDTSNHRKPSRERKASVSSIMTDSSLASEDVYSPISSPRKFLFIFIIYIYIYIYFYVI